jgi:hypothetical protein
MAASDAEYSMIVPQGLTTEQLQDKVQYWIEFGRNATGENKAWTDGMVEYLRRRIDILLRVLARIDLYPRTRSSVSRFMYSDL